MAQKSKFLNMKKLRDDFHIMHYYVIMGMTWTIIMTASFIWNRHHQINDTINTTRIHLNSAFEKDVLFRRWNTQVGPIYAPITKTTPPNPYLADIPNRDFVTPFGDSLTRINPAYMTRQVHELEQESLNSRGHITSLTPIRPENAPDEWERSALLAFNQGEKEFLSMDTLDGVAYYRFMRPLVTEKSCLECHAKQGYKINDIRGGISITLPAAPILAVRNNAIRRSLLIHLILWLVGIFSIAIGYRIDVSKQKHTLQSLRASEERYRSVFENTGTAMIIVNQDSTIAFANRECEISTGYSPEELQGTKWTNYVEPKSLQRMLEFFQLRFTMPDLAPDRYETRLIHADGSVKISLISVGIIPNSEQIVVSILDITDRKHAEEALVEREEKYRNFVRNASEGIYRIDFKKPIPINLPEKELQQRIGENAVVGEVNNALAEMYGLKPEDMIGHLATDFAPEYGPRGALVVKAHNYQVIEEDTVDVDKEGNPVYLTENFTGIVEDGFLIRIWGMQRDVSEKKKAEEALKASEDRYKTLFEFAADGILVADLKTKQLKYANRAITRMLGYTNEELLQMGVADIHPQDKLEWVISVFEAQARGEKRVASDIPLLRKDGAIVNADVSAAQVMIDGEPCNVGFFTDTTERKQAAEEMEKLITVLKYSNELVNIASLDGTMTFLNEAGCEMLGIDPENVTSTHIMQVIPDHLTELVETELLPTLMRAETWEGDLQYINLKTGNLTDVHAITFTVKDTNTNEPLYLANVSLDITKRKQAERAIKENEARLQSIFRVAPTGIGTVSNRIIQDVNEKICDMLGYSKKELVGQNARILYPTDEDFEYVGKEKYKQIKKKGTGTVEARWQKKDGGIIHVLLSSTPINPDYPTENVTFTALDITERKESRATIQESEEKYRNFFNSVRECVFISSKDGKWIDMNDAAVEMFGYQSKKELSKLPVRKLYANAKDRETHIQIVEDQGFVKDRPIDLKKKDGSIIHTLVSTVPIKDADGKITAYQGTIHDVTEQKNAEIQITKSLREKEVLLKEVHHRVKNNLQVISSLLNLQSGYVLDEHAQEMFKDTQGRIRSMAYVHEALYLSENLAMINISEHIEKLVRSIRQSYSDISGTVEINVYAEPIYIGIDIAVPCGLIINELVSNAFKHAFPPSYKGTGHVDITFRKAHDNSLEIIVKDNGAGLPENIEIETAESLGLRLVHILATDQLGGNVHVTRTKGTTFKIQFEQAEG